MCIWYEKNSCAKNLTENLQKAYHDYDLRFMLVLVLRFFSSDNVL